MRLIFVKEKKVEEEKRKQKNQKRRRENQKKEDALRIAEEGKLFP